MQTPFPAQDQFLDLYRNGIRSASDVAQAWLQTSLRLHEKQLEAVRGMIDENARTTERLGEARSLEDLVSVQSRLAGTQMQRLGEFWSTLWQTAAESQQEFAGRVRSQASQATQFPARAPANQAKQEHRKSA